MSEISRVYKAAAQQLLHVNSNDAFSLVKNFLNDHIDEYSPSEAYELGKLVVLCGDGPELPFITPGNVARYIGDNRTYDKGQIYATTGKVHHVQLRADLVLVGEVEGQFVYNVGVPLSSEGPKKGWCSCMDNKIRFRNCKHQAALLIHYINDSSYKINPPIEKLISSL